MATRRSSFEKRERDKAKKAKAAAKREKRATKGDEPDDDDVDGSSPSGAPEGQVDEQAVLDELARLHARYDDGEMDLDEFEERRTELLARLTID